MELARSGRISNQIHDDPPVNRHRPSVDVLLFHSVAKHAGRNAVNVILEDGQLDGAAGMLAMYPGLAHGPLLANSCVVFGVRAGPSIWVAIGRS